MNIPSDIRPKAYAGAELFLDLLHILREAHGWDLETLAIYYSISEATMRPLIVGKKKLKALLNVERPPEEFRGSVSRLAISERTGIARETVRRKANELLKSGHIYEDETGQLRTHRNLGEARVQARIRDTARAVERYNARLKQLLSG